ncbi:MAG: hypothetical protein EHM80_12965, partial [Nitrospiraceae bacterium]
MALAIVAGPVLAHAQLVEKTALTLDGAKKIAAAAEAKAKTEGARVVIAVVDEGGSLLLLERLDDTQVASVNVGIDKARTAAIYRRPSKVFEDQVKNGRVFAFGLSHAFDDSSKAPVQGGYRLAKDGTVTLLIHDIKAPNGIAFSPDEKTLYVSDVDPKRAAWLAYDVQPNGTVTNGRVFFDATRWRKDPFFGPDGFKVDRQGNIFGARPGGLSVIAPDGTLLGTIETGQPTS